MDVSLALLADYANITKEGKLNILGIFDRIYSNNFPFKHPQMQLIMKFEASIAESNQTKTLEVKLIDDDGKAIFSLGGEMKLPQGRPGETMGTANILTLNNMKFDKTGTFDFHILINGEDKKTVSLRVEKPPSMG